jgi:SnoaL-like domain
MDARAAARRWRDAWERAWREHDADGTAALYARDAVLQSHWPKDYIEPTLAMEPSTECEFDEPLVDGDRAAVAWRAQPRTEGGGREHLEGVSLLRFDTAGLVVEQRDFWGRVP